MTLDDRLYRRTDAGSQALASEDTAIPTDYRRILRLVEGSTHADVIRGCLRQYPDSLLADWLAELEELGFLASVPADSSQDLDFSGLLKVMRSRAASPAPEDAGRVEGQARQAGMALERQGAFLSPDRLKHRPALAKTPEQTVVLIVEDDPDQAALADLRVSMAGYQVRVAQSLKSLREELRTRALPDLVLLDVRLADGDGFDILAGMRRHPKLALLPVVMLTAVVGEDNVRRGLALGADGYVTKPYSKNIVVEAIRDILKQG